LQRITEISTNSEITRQNINVFGRLSSIERAIIEEPTVSLDTTYYLADGFNESGIGFTTFSRFGTSVNCLSGILANAPEAQKNYYILTVDEGIDANGIDPQSATDYGVVGVGNGYLSNYSVNLSVGDIPTANISIEAANISFDLTSSSGIQNPAINNTLTVPTQFTGLVSLPIASTGNLEVKVLRPTSPGDIVLDFGGSKLDMGGAALIGRSGDFTGTTAHVQSVTIDLPLARTPLSRLGNAFAFSRELDVPIDVSMSVSANLGDIESGSLIDLICAGSAERDITVKLYTPCGGGDEAELNLMFTLKGATLDSQNMSSTIGDSKTVELTFTSQIGGPNDQTKGLFISGKF
jgi:hypothetical protein